MLETCPHCKTSVFANKDRTCPQCRGNLDGAPAPKRVRNGLVSAVCPNCKGTQFRKVKPDRWIAFAPDRACLACHTRYVLPTPAWAATLFIVIGLLFVAGSILDIFIHVRDSEWYFVVVKILWIILGLAAIRHGVRALRRLRRVS